MRTSILFVAVLAGFAGGSVASHITSVYAQVPGVEIIRSRSFVLLDAEGRKRGEWMVNPSGQPVLRMYDAEGREIWDTTGTHGRVVPIAK
jgi:hypothetical protein